MLGSFISSFLLWRAESTPSVLMEEVLTMKIPVPQTFSFPLLGFYSCLLSQMGNWKKPAPHLSRFQETNCKPPIYLFFILLKYK